MLKQSQIKRAPEGSFYGNAVHALFALEGHRAATGRTSSGDGTAPARTPVGLQAAVRLPSGDRAVNVQFMLSISFNHLLKTDISGELLRILNKAFQTKREKEEDSTNFVAV